jgi:hypothetical protein
MFGSVRNLVFRSEAPPAAAASSIALFLASMIIFSLWMSFATHLPRLPCKPTDTLLHFRSSTLCATREQAAHWAHEGVMWKTLFASSFFVHWGGMAYRKFVARQESAREA